jgi:hypothetical protein
MYVLFKDPIARIFRGGKSKKTRGEDLLRFWVWVGFVLSNIVPEQEAVNLIGIGTTGFEFLYQKFVFTKI